MNNLKNKANLKKTFKPFTINEFNARIDRSEENFRKGEFINVDVLIKKYNK